MLTFAASLTCRNRFAVIANPLGFVGAHFCYTVELRIVEYDVKVRVQRASDLFTKEGADVRPVTRRTTSPSNHYRRFGYVGAFNHGPAFRRCPHAYGVCGNPVTAKMLRVTIVVEVLRLFGNAGDDWLYIVEEFDREHCQTGH